MAPSLLGGAVSRRDGALRDLRVLVAPVHAVGVAVAHPPLVDAPGAAPVVVLLALELALRIAFALF